MADDLIVVFGGSGFIGKQVVRALAKRGKRPSILVTPLTTGEERSSQCLPLPREGTQGRERRTSRVNR